MSATTASVSARHALVRRIFAGTSGSYGLAVRAGTLGMDILWKRAMLRLIPADLQCRKPCPGCGGTRGGAV